MILPSLFAATLPWDQLSDPKFCPFPARCDIDVVDAKDGKPDLFERNYRGQRPVLLRHQMTQWRSLRAWTRKNMLRMHGGLLVAVGNSTSIVNNGGQSPRMLTLEEYLRSMRNNDRSTFKHYAFDGDFFDRSTRASSLMDDCQPLPRSISDAIGTYANRSSRSRATRYFSLGRKGTGVGWHSHSEGWLFNIAGSKRVFFYNPDTLPPLEYPNWRTPSEWISQVLPRIPQLENVSSPMECTVYPGDTLYIPGGILHSTFNCAETLAIAIQMRQQEPIHTPEHMFYASQRSRAISDHLAQQRGGAALSKVEEAIADKLLKEAVRRSPQDPLILLHYSEILESKGLHNESLKIMRHAYQRCRHTPRCGFSLSWALTRVSRETAVQFAKMSSLANKATTVADRQIYMARRSEISETLRTLYVEFASALGEALALDPDNPLGVSEGAYILGQHRRVVPGALRKQFDEIISMEKQAMLLELFENELTNEGVDEL